MLDHQVIIASAVIVPEVHEDSIVSSKRRQSSNSEDPDSKRARLSQDRNVVQAGSSSSPTTTTTSSRRTSRHIDERNRGKRLFGGLLGTLSQNSSSTAQKRRIDIEKKQQEKLKLQAKKDDETEKHKVEEVARVRRQEQERYNLQSMFILHSNALAVAHFLQTTTEPRLYYKPWELRPEDKAKIQSQIGKTETSIKQASDIAQMPKSDTAQLVVTSLDPTEKPETVGQASNKAENNDSTPTPDTNPDPVVRADTGPADTVQESRKECVEDVGDDVVEGEEDTVIY